jgi:hypothetical protein
VLEELRTGAIHLTGLFLLSTHLTEDNAEALLGEARGKSRRQVEVLIARWFPRRDVAPSIEPVVTRAETGRTEQLGPPEAHLGALHAAPSRVTCPGTCRPGSPGRIEPLSVSSYRVEFTARAELRDKLERARELLSHALPKGELGELFERALDALIEQETRRRLGAGRPRRLRKLKEGSRHVPVEIARAVWERDAGQCTDVDAEGRRCSERRFLTLEHQKPFALGGPATLDNLCLLCACHNAGRARAVFGERHIEDKIQARGHSPRGPDLNRTELARTAQSGRDRSVTAMTEKTYAKVLSALCRLGFEKRSATAAVARMCASEPGLSAEKFLRKTLVLLTPPPS